MRDWTKIFRVKNNVARLNNSLTNSLVHCLSLGVGGWNFRCVECHIATGTYPSGYTSNQTATSLWHSHNEYQIEIALSGAFEFYSPNSKKITIRPVTALLIPWKQAHRFKCIKSGVMIGISLELLPTPESIRQNGWLVDEMRKAVSTLIKLRTYDLIKSGLKNGNPALLSKISASHLFLLLAAIMEQALPSAPDNDSILNQRTSETRGRDVIGWVAHLLDKNLGADVNLKQVAREVGLSTRQIHRLFLKHVGKSLHDYLLERRLEEARNLITAKNQKMQVKEIAFSCGFNSLSYFCTAFKRIYGITPSSLLLPNVALKSGTTYRYYKNSSEAPVLTSAARKRASTSAARKARG